MGNLLWILFIAFALAWFWQQRRQSEFAKRFIQQRCETVDVQLLSIARGSQTYGWPKGPINIQTRYYFEFSANGADCFQGHAVMKGMRLQEIYMPPYPVRR